MTLNTYHAHKVDEIHGGARAHKADLHLRERITEQHRSFAIRVLLQCDCVRTQQHLFHPTEFSCFSAFVITVNRCSLYSTR